MSDKTPRNPKSVATEADPFHRIKHLGYCLSQPPGKLDVPTLSDFVRFCRYQLCQAKRMLFWDPVWDSYTDEQILVEYYAMVFEKDKEAREEFEGKLGVPIEEDLAWMDEQISKNQKEDRSEAAEEPEEFEETPASLGKNE